MDNNFESCSIAAVQDAAASEGRCNNDAAQQQSSATASKHENAVLLRSLRGIVVPIVTPLLLTTTSGTNTTSSSSSSSMSIDVDGTKKLVEHVLKGGVASIFVLGSSGECPSLSRKLRHEFVELVCRTVRGRGVPVLAGVIGTCLEEIVQDAVEYRKSGVSALVLTPPFYYHVSQEAIFHWCQQVVEQVQPPMPVILYNMPDFTKAKFEIETVEKLLEQYGLGGPNSSSTIIGIKDSSGDLDYFRQLCDLKKRRLTMTNTKKRRLHDNDDDEVPGGDGGAPVDEKDDENGDFFAVLMGPEYRTVEAMEMGADGIVPGGANVLPNLFVDLHRACYQMRCNNNNSERGSGNDDSTRIATKNKVSALSECVKQFQAIYDVPAASWFVALKMACQVRGLISTSIAAPPFFFPAAGGGDDRSGDGADAATAAAKESIRKIFDDVAAAAVASST